jgi:ribonuclease Y
VDVWTYVVIGTTALLSLAVGYSGAVLMGKLRVRSAAQRASELLAEAHRKADHVLKEAELKRREEEYRLREQLQKERQEMERHLREQERQLARREQVLEDQMVLLAKKEATVEATQRKLNEQIKEQEHRLAELAQLIQKEKELLERATGMTEAEARQLLLRRIEEDMAEEIGERLRRFELELRDRADQKAKEILATAIQRYAAAYTGEVTTCVVDLPDEEMKGRIIGREGRNIRAFERATGVDVIVDDTPGIVVLSSFDPVRREIARLTMQKLIQDGRIHPARIEEIVQETTAELDQYVRKLGRQAAEEVGVTGLHEKLVELLGKLKFRTSYSQNVLQHSIEVAHLAGLMAEELGLDATLARRCGLLHDIGKAADHEMEGGHPEIGAELARRYREPAEVIHACAGHHDDLRSDQIYTVLVAAADAISASRPGARRETLEKYLKRLEELERVATSFPGVVQAYAIQAGREVRVLVDPGRISDKLATKLCRDIAKAIERSVTYPGEIKVTVIREVRAVDYAR